MTDTPKDPTPSLPISEGPEKVGDILRKERVTRRITVETIAKDLKLNASYIKALEANDYDTLPADPYVRVYIRSISSYLMLNPDEVLQKFYDDRGLGLDAFKEDRSTQISISLKSRDKPTIPWLILLPIALVLAILSFTALKKGWIQGAAKSDIEAPAEQAKEPEQYDNENIEMPPADIPDSITASEESPIDSNIQEEEIETDETSLAPPLPGTAMKFTMRAVSDSVWVQVFRDGNSWRNFIHAGKTRVFRVQDSLNVHVGNNSSLRYTLNGDPVKVKGGGVVIFKVARKGIEYWSLKTWKRTFKGRL